MCKAPYLSPPLPVDAALPELFAALMAHGSAILTAAPGSGKTTRVPLFLADKMPGKILLLEPRRLAARSAAGFMARSLGQEVGQRIGYRVRLESKVSAATQVELLTEGVLTRRLLADPLLEGVSCVIFDEFHERSLQADLALALCLESIEALRPDLKLLIMSATLQAGEISTFLGACPAIEASGKSYPVELSYAPAALQVTPSLSPAEVAGRVALAVRQSLQTESGSILAFLPGQGEIHRTAELLPDLPMGVQLRPLYGELSLQEQEGAIAPAPKGQRKVVLATDIAQTSLTIEGISLVIDAGLARGMRFDPATCLPQLVTTRLAGDAAAQRSGRAGRLEAGKCLRLWGKGEVLAEQSRPEILDADLTPLCLEALSWGSEPEKLSWLTAPPEPALKQAKATLISIGAATYKGTTGRRLSITAYGQELARLPLHPRLSHMILQAGRVLPDMALTDAAKYSLSSLAACLAAILSERDPLRKGAGGWSVDIRSRLALLKRPEHKRLRQSAEQLFRICNAGKGAGSFALPGPDLEDYCGSLLSLAYPERIAQKREKGQGYRMAAGQGATLPEHDALQAQQWLVVASLGNAPANAKGGANRTVHLAAPVSLADLTRLHAGMNEFVEEVFWDSRAGAVCCRKARKMGALILEEKPCELSPTLQLEALKAIQHGIIEKGLTPLSTLPQLPLLPWTDELRQFQARVMLLRHLEPELGLPDITDAALFAGLAVAVQSDDAASWLSPYLAGISRLSQLAGVPLGDALRSMLPWEFLNRVERDLPQRLDLPSGNTARIDYLPALKGEPPVLAVKLQEMFGQLTTPTVAGGRVSLMLHLLSPAGKPLQVTADLPHFWAHGYKAVRAEMRGRYPRHPWPEDPITAVPTSKTNKRLAASAVMPKCSDAKRTE